MLIVLNTNILVSGLLNAHGAPGRILDLVLAGKIQLLFDDRMLAEYRDVLTRPKFNFDTVKVTSIFAFLQLSGKHIVAPPLPGIENMEIADIDDLPFAEVAFAGNATSLVTGNVRHFTFFAKYQISILTPRQFMETWSS